MYNNIVNPITNRKVNINSKSGSRILRMYLSQIGGTLDKKCGIPSVNPIEGEIPFYRSETGEGKICRNEKDSADWIDLDEVDRRNIIVIKKGGHVYCGLYQTIINLWKRDGNLCNWYPCEMSECMSSMKGCHVNITRRDLTSIVLQLQNIIDIDESEFSEDEEEGILLFADTSNVRQINYFNVTQTKDIIQKVINEMTACSNVPITMQPKPSTKIIHAIFSLLILLRILAYSTKNAISELHDPTGVMENSIRHRTGIGMINIFTDYLRALPGGQGELALNIPFLRTDGSLVEKTTNSETLGAWLKNAATGKLYLCFGMWGLHIQDFYEGLVNEAKSAGITYIYPNPKLGNSEDTVIDYIKSVFTNEEIKSIECPNFYDIMDYETQVGLGIINESSSPNDGSKFLPWKQNIESFFKDEISKIEGTFLRDPTVKERREAAVQGIPVPCSCVN